MNVEIRTEATQFPEKEYINGIFVAVQLFSLLYLKFSSVAAGPHINAAEPSSSFLRPLL
jgi:hypothetical protein